METVLNQKTSIYASFDKLIWLSTYNDFAIALYKNEGNENISKNTFICKGNSIPTVKGPVYKFDGSWVNDPKYGIQFNIDNFSESQRENKNDIIAFLESPIIKGVGKITAKRIYDKFGNDTFKILDNTPERLKEVKGITNAKYEKIIESYKNSRQISKIYSFLNEYGDFSLKLCKKIIEKYDNDSLDIIKAHPYWLCSLKDVGFHTADKIAKAQGLPLDSMERFRAASNHVLLFNESNGNLGLELQEYGRNVKDVLNTELATPKFINEMLGKLIKQKDIICKHIHTSKKNIYYLYRPYTYHVEKDVADKIWSLSSKKGYKIDNLDEKIRKKETELHISLNEEQRNAIKTALTNTFSVILGGPGTGKTTITKIICQIFKEEYKDRIITLMAPTGRAARRLQDSTGYPASTIHSRLQILDSDFQDKNNGRDEDLDIYDSLVIVDESSMIDIWVADRLFQAIKGGCQLVFVGDSEQLQSVGPGAVLRDIINSGAVEKAELKQIFRQNGDSSIAENTLLIKNGKANLIEDEEFVINDNLNGKNLEDAMVKAYIEEVNKYGIENVVCLCPVRDYEAGVYSMNAKIQEILNPKDVFDPAEIKIGKNIFRVGDPVMELQNTDKTLNGDIGFIKRIVNLKGAEEIEVEFFGDTTVIYKKDDLDRITLAYAMTVHKAQGSEYMSVITCLQNVNRHMQKRNLVYTAISRGKKKVQFFGNKNALINAINNNDTDIRNTLLADYLGIMSGKEMEYLI